MTISTLDGLLHLHTPQIDFHMGNFSLIYLQYNNTPINCSVYSLTNGTIRLLDHYNQTWNNDLHLHEYLPAYYITNCSIPQLIDLVEMEKYDNESSLPTTTTTTTTTNNGALPHVVSNNENNPYNQKDNGDTFIALLFTLCGSCVSCWMLSLLLYLTPKHKRKPWLTQITTIYYAIVTSVLLNRLTKAAEQEYYNDILDIIKLHHYLYNTNLYRVLMVLTQVFTMCSWFQIIQKITRLKYRYTSAVISFIFMGFYIAVFTYYQVSYNTQEFIHNQINRNQTHYNWSIVRALGRLLIITWFGLNLLHYTVLVKNPSKICYNRKLFPLAFFIWFLIVLDIVVTILHITLFRHSWLVRTWLILIPYLLEITLLTVVWEWVFNIWILEKRFELMNVLGRRISYEDVVDFKRGEDDEDEENNDNNINGNNNGNSNNNKESKKRRRVNKINPMKLIGKIRNINALNVEENYEESLKEMPLSEQTNSRTITATEEEAEEEEEEGGGGGGGSGGSIGENVTPIISPMQNAVIIPGNASSGASNSNVNANRTVIVHHPVNYVDDHVSETQGEIGNHSITTETHGNDTTNQTNGIINDTYNDEREVREEGEEEEEEEEEGEFDDEYIDNYWIREDDEDSTF